MIFISLINTSINTEDYLSFPAEFGHWTPYRKFHEFIGMHISRNSGQGSETFEKILQIVMFSEHCRFDENLLIQKFIEQKVDVCHLIN